VTSSRVGQRVRSAARPALLLMVAVTLPACGHRARLVPLGLKRFSLDIAFKDQRKAAQVPSIPQIVAVQQPVPTVTQLVGSLPRPSGAPTTTANESSVRAAPACPTAPAGALPHEPVSGIVGKPPAAGIYSLHNHGTFTLDGPLSLKGEFPPATSMEIANVKDFTTPDATGQPARTISYDVIERSPLSTTTTSYASTATELDLVATVTTTNGQSTSFHPTPPITLMQYQGEGSSWKSAGIDPATGTSMLVQGSIEKREAVDVCGTLYESYRVVSSEQVTNIAAGYDSRTNADDPNVYNVATQLGGLVIRKHVDTTTTFRVNGAQATLVVINTGTVDSVTPVRRSSS